MRPLRTLSLALTLMLIGTVAPGAVWAQEEQGGVLLVANLTGMAEVPGPGDEDGAGVGIVHLLWDDMAGAYTVCFALSAVRILPPVGAHIHPGAADVAGPVVVPFEPPRPLASGCVDVEQELGERIIGDPEAFYVNVHTPDFPGGAVRGQLMAL